MIFVINLEAAVAADASSGVSEVIVAASSALTTARDSMSLLCKNLLTNSPKLPDNPGAVNEIPEFSATNWRRAWAENEPESG